MSKPWEWWEVPDFHYLARTMAYSHGRRMAEAGLGLGNVKYGDRDNEENYVDGKIGEMAFGRWLEINNVNVLHTPFRWSYDELHPWDDFIILLRGKVIGVEVRHKTRNVDPKEHYEHCSPPPIKTNRIYVFTERRREDMDAFVAEPWVRPFGGPVRIVGWLPGELVEKRGRFIPKFTEMLNGAGRVNFVTHRDEWNVKIADLFAIGELLDGTKDDVIPKLEVDP